MIFVKNLIMLILDIIIEKIIFHNFNKIDFWEKIFILFIFKKELII